MLWVVTIPSHSSMYAINMIYYTSFLDQNLIAVTMLKAYGPAYISLVAPFYSAHTKPIYEPHSIVEPCGMECLYQPLIFN